MPRWLDDVQRDLRWAIRALTRTPGFAVVAIITLALGFEIFGVEKRCLSVDGVHVDEEHPVLDLNRIRR